MQLPDDGGPAFPFVTPYANVAGVSPGMTLRDWFAAQAMDRMISLTQDRDGSWSPDAVAIGCYAMADAMIEARKPDAAKCAECGGPESGHVANYYCSVFKPLPKAA